MIQPRSDDDIIHPVAPAQIHRPPASRQVGGKTAGLAAPVRVEVPIHRVTRGPASCQGGLPGTLPQGQIRRVVVFCLIMESEKG